MSEKFTTPFKINNTTLSVDDKDFGELIGISLDNKDVTIDFKAQNLLLNWSLAISSSERGVEGLDIKVDDHEFTVSGEMVVYEDEEDVEKSFSTQLRLYDVEVEYDVRDLYANGDRMGFLVYPEEIIWSRDKTIVKFYVGS